MKADSFDFIKPLESSKSLQNSYHSKNAKLKVLVIDDFQGMRTSIRSNLMGHGFKYVFVANDGLAGKRILEHEHIDLIISDWNMPKISGIELLQYVKNEEELAHIYFMLVTAESNRDLISYAISEGVDNFLVKPFTAKKLTTKVQQMLSNPIRKRQDGPSSEMSDKPKKVVKPQPLTAKPNILIVDDTPTNIEVIAGILKSDYRIKVATNGEKALNIAITAPQPDLILLDIMMPEMDGYQVCEKLKEAAETETIPVIFLTAKSEVADITKGFELGAVDYISKPAIPEVLKARVRTHIQLKHSKDELTQQVEHLIETARLREDVERITRHDLKSPLSAIINTSDSLLESQYMGVEQKQSIELIRDSSYDVLGMINRSLDLYKMETGTYQLEAVSFDIVKTTQKIVNESRINAHEMDITIEFNASSTYMVLGEEILCLSLLSNLIKNSVEATQQGGIVNVLVKCDEMVKIYIHNSTDVPLDIRDNFFEKYVTSGKKQGTGLGTYSAKLMAKVQMGDVSLSSKESKGTTLLVTLPIDPEFDHSK